MEDVMQIGQAVKDAFAELLDNTAKFREETKEITGFVDYFDIPITIEFLGASLEFLEYVTREYFDNGKLKYECPYRNGKIHGVITEWYKSGQLQRKEEYQNGEQQGIDKYWHKNGQLQWEHQYQGDKRHGVSRGWNENGKLEYIAEYQNNRKVS